MNLQSMTGFARAVAEHDGTSIAWEVKSVNGKSVEVRLRLPQGFERLEPVVRQTLQKRFARGNFQATLTIGRAAGTQAQPIVNEAFLKDLAGLAKRLQEQFGVAPATADGLLSLRGVLDVPETIETEEARTALDAAIMAALDVALNGLEQARHGEGAALAVLLSGHVDTIETLTLSAEADPSRDAAVIRERIA
ncbi:YicC family protein, partial [Mesorhizobium sp. M2D.F.Ca.ET.145.01.1.1]